jgi:hypothetical protein
LDTVNNCAGMVGSFWCDGNFKDGEKLITISRDPSTGHYRWANPSNPLSAWDSHTAYFKGMTCATPEPATEACAPVAPPRYV